jgi:4-amino-4-deoxy-L-arabinose transferase-like glycosyltransferase
VLSKGPVQLLNIVTVVLLAPLWLPEKHGPWSRWYGGLAFAIVSGAVIALLWAIPAAIAGGTQFAYMLFIGQTTERVVEALWHERPWWWYVPISFALLFPWLCWTEVWRGAFVRTLAREPGVRFCLSMVVPVFVAFSAISGKQPHYLLPTMAVFALLAARPLVALRETERFRDTRWRRVLPVLPVAAIGLAMIVLGIAPGLITERVPAAADVLPLPGLAGCGAVLIVIALAILADGERGPVVRAATFAFAIVAALIAIEVAAAPYLHARYATDDTAAVLAQLQANGTPIAHIDDYHGQYHFAGRLTKPIDPVTRDGVIAWIDAHPDGAVIDYRVALPGADAPPALYTHPYRGRFVVVWPAAAIAERGRGLLD